ncbi:deacetylase [Sphaerisporangium rufum]|uniref:Deacetylase n=1 Tax=Sphaerisporangium rufum TaxID=1381558 RepID=A0A919QX59_9ACTN|nr:polysaccharide deacetylase family protein [Sphaerisporangium rufum]GII75602.1 deacetylase [Sphaerisporangium rufum]
MRSIVPIACLLAAAVVFPAAPAAAAGRTAEPAAAVPSWSTGSTGSTAAFAASTAGRAPYCARVKCIALTFDDGPGRYTARSLDILRAHRAKATFFLVGRQVEKYPALARRMVREGHVVGDHTATHPRLTALSDTQIRAQLRDAQDVITRATGRTPDLMRPPYGDTDARVASVAAEFGLSQILWNGSSRDWELRDTRAITRKVTGLARRDGVILMHDVWPETVAAMPAILRNLKKRGYHLVPVTALLRDRPLGAGETYPPRR